MGSETRLSWKFSGHCYMACCLFLGPPWLNCAHSGFVWFKHEFYLQLNLRMPKLQATFKPIVAVVCHERQFCKMFSWLFCFVQVKALKSFSEKLYTSTIKKKRRSRGENCLHSCATSLFFITFDVTCDLGRQLLNRHMKTWNLLLLNWYCTTEKCRILAIITKLINKSWGK